MVKDTDYRCQWNGCLKKIHGPLMLEHISNHVGYRRDGTFNGYCKWICTNGPSAIPNLENTPRECGYLGTSRHLLLSHVKRHLETSSYTCGVCKKSSYKWKHDKLKHERKCKRKMFENLVDLLFDGIPSPQSSTA